MLVLEIFADRGDLRQVASVVEFERRHLSVRVALKMRLLAIFASAFFAKVGQPIETANQNIGAWIERVGGRPSMKA